MQPETNLEKLIKTMQPIMQDGLFVFHSSQKSFKDLLAFEPIQLFRESEGTAAILKKDIADQNNLDYSFVSKMITLNVYSSLEAVGFLAAITKKLAEKKISVNAVSAYHHDHLFVPVAKSEDALKVLEDMVSS